MDNMKKYFMCLALAKIAYIDTMYPLDINN